jgi:hypothetical protein
VDEKRKFVRRFISLEKPGMTNGTDALIEVYETYEDLEEETTTQEEEDNES